LAKLCFLRVLRLKGSPLRRTKPKARRVSGLETSEKQIKNRRLAGKKKRNERGATKAQDSKKKKRAQPRNQRQSGSEICFKKQEHAADNNVQKEKGGNGRARLCRHGTFELGTIKATREGGKRGVAWEVGPDV